MQNKHEEYIRLSTNKKTACLMVHGIVGTPRYFDEIIPLLPQSWSIYNILLDGHGKKVKDFSQSSMNRWKEQVREMLIKLREEYEEIVIVAHSMGTLLTMREIVENKEKVSKMILFAVPLVPFVKPVAISMALKVIFKNVSEDNAQEIAAKKQYSIEPDWRLWRYVGFIPRYLELLDLMKEMRTKINSVNVPCNIFMCRMDEMVSKRSKKYLKDNPYFTNHILANSSHNWFEENDFEFVQKILTENIL